MRQPRVRRLPDRKVLPRLRDDADQNTAGQTTQ
jgi:hypothetical protein